MTIKISNKERDTIISMLDSRIYEISDNLKTYPYGMKQRNWLQNEMNRLVTIKRKLSKPIENAIKKTT